MYALCVSGAVNTQGFVWKFFLCAIYKFSFIHSFTESYGYALTGRAECLSANHPPVAPLRLLAYCDTARSLGYPLAVVSLIHLTNAETKVADFALRASFISL